MVIVFLCRSFGTQQNTIILYYTFFTISIIFANFSKCFLLQNCTNSSREDIVLEFLSNPFPERLSSPTARFFFDATGTKNGQSRTTPTKNDVIRYAHNDVAHDGRNDVMFAHYAVRRNIIYEVNIIAEGNITCPQGQTSFG
jgi:hypothetical protein